MEDLESPVLAAIRGGYGTSTGLAGLAPDLLVTDPDGWLPAAALAGADVGLLLAAAQRRWPAQPHVAAALIWKAYSYWLAVPAVFGWVAARRMPHLTASAVLVRFDAPHAPVRLGLRADIAVSVLPGDPLAGGGRPRVEVAPDEAALLARLRRTLLDEHVGPVLDAVLGSVRISRRLLLGSVASGIAHATRHAATAVGAPPGAHRAELLTALGLADLVDASAEGPVYRRTCCLLFTLPGTRFCGDCSYRRR